MFGSDRIFLGGVGLCFAGVVSSVLWAHRSADETPSLHVSPTSVDWGTLLQGDVFTHAFELENAGDAPLTITKVMLSCGCASERHDAEIPPHGSGHLTLNIDTGPLGPGTHAKSATLFTNDPRTPRLELQLTGQVTPVVTLEPSLVSLVGFPGDSLRTSCTLTAATELGLEIQELTMEHGHASVDLSPLVAGRSFTLRLQAPSSPRAQTLGDTLQVSLKTSDGKLRKLLFAVEIRHRRRLDILPRSFLVFTREETEQLPNPSATLEKQVTVRTEMPGHSFHVLSATVEKAPPDAFQTRVETIEEGRQYRVTVFLRKRVRSRSVKSELVITTDDSEQPRLTVTLHAQF